MKKRRLAALELLFLSLLFLSLTFPSLALPAGIYEIKTGAHTGTRTITGVVSLVETTFRFFMAEGSGQYQAIYVDQTNWGPEIGDEVTVTGTVQTSSGRIQLGNVTALTVNSVGNPVHAPIEMNIGHLISNLDSYEGSLVKLTTPLNVTNQNAGDRIWRVGDGTGTVDIDARLDYNYYPRNGDQLSAIAGVVKKTGATTFRIHPRFTNDLWAANEVIPNYALRGTVVTMDDDRNVLTDHYIWVRGDSIESVTETAPAGAEKIIDVDGLIFPGLISTHDHPTWNVFDWIPFGRFFRERNDWANDVFGGTMYHDFKNQKSGFGQDNQVIKLTEVRLASSGATVLQGAGTAQTGWLGLGVIHGERFPGRVQTRVVGTTGSGQDDYWALRHERANRGILHRYMPHLAETTDAGPTMAGQWNEWKTYDSFDGRDTIIHGMNIPAGDFALFNTHGEESPPRPGRPRRTVLSWAALSNMLLYNSTADIEAAINAGAIVCLAPDWTPSGMPNMLAELNFARSVALDKGWNIQTQTFIDMVTRNAAIGFGQLWRMGTIEPGKMANFMVIDDGPGDPYDDLMMVAGGGEDPNYRGGPRDVRLTIVAGRPIYGDSDLLNTANFPFLFEGRIEDLEICGVIKKLKIARWNPGWLPDIAGELFEPMYLDLWARYVRSDQYPADFLPVDPCGAVPPTPAPTPTPPPGTYIIMSSSDDASEHSTYYTDNDEFIWIGRRHTVSAGYNAGFRFEDVQVHPGEYVTDAHVVFTQYFRDNTATPDLKIRAHSADNSPTFTSADGPLGRPLTSARVNWKMPAAAVDAEITTPNFRSVIQEIVDRPGWSAGNAISIILEPEDVNFDNRRRVWAYDGYPELAARLKIEVGAAPTPVCLPAEGFPEGFDDYDLGVRPAGWDFTNIGDGDVYTELGYYGVAAPSLKIDSGAEVVSREFFDPVYMFFWLRGTAGPDPSFLLVDEFYSDAWHYVAEVYAPDTYGGRVEGPLSLYRDATRVRFTYSDGTVALDDVQVCVKMPVPTPTPEPEPTPTPAPTPDPGDTIVLYTFTGPTLEPEETAAGVTASNFAVSEGSILFGSWNADDWAALGSGVPYVRAHDGWDAADVTQGKYFYFTIEPPSSGHILVEAMDFLYRVPDEEEGPANITVMVGDTVVYTVDPVEFDSTEPVNILGLGLTVTGETAFKIVGWGALFESGEFHLDDIRLGGQVQVGPTPIPTPPVPTPEPTPPAPTPPGPTPELVTLVDYPFTGDSLAPTDLAAGVNASNFSVSTGDILFGTGQPDSWTGSGIPYAYSPNGWDAGEWTEGKYFYFTVEPALPGTLMVEEMDFLYRVPPWDGVPTKLTVAVGDDEIFTVDPVVRAETLSFAVDGLDLAITGETTFKIVGWGALEPGGELRVDDVRLGGYFLAAITPTPTSTPTPSPVGFKTPSPPPTASPTPTPVIFWPTPPPAPTPPYAHWYLAAGGTEIEGYLFDNYALIYNPNPFRVDYDVSFHDGSGKIASFEQQTIPALSRRTIKVNKHVGPSVPSVSTRVSSAANKRLMVERAMYWPRGGPLQWTGGHGTLGTDSLSKEWYLAEGATHLFDKFIHVFNPNPSAAAVTIELFNQAGGSWKVSSTVGPEANWTFKANDLADNQSQLSAVITSDRPVAVERTMYWNKDDWRDGHASRGISRVSPVWHFAEGATHIFDYYIVVLNPSASENSQTRFTFLLEGSEPIVHEVDIPPRRRHTVNVGDIIGSRSQVAARVDSVNGVALAAERTLYWDAFGSRWEGGHGTVGASSPSTVWYLPEGATHVFDEYVLVSNPDPERAAQVRFRFHASDGTEFTVDRTVPPLRRETVNVGSVVGQLAEVSTHVYTLNAVGVVVERAMYWPRGSAPDWSSGHGSIGLPTSIVAPTPNAQP